MGDGKTWSDGSPDSQIFGFKKASKNSCVCNAVEKSYRQGRLQQPGIPYNQ